MNILVFDDTKINQDSARLLLAKDHSLMVVGTYDDAQKALVSVIDYAKERELLPDLLKKAGLSQDFSPWQKDSNAPESDKQKYRVASKMARELATKHPNFDVLLTDLLVPASRQAQGPEGAKLVGTEQSLGTTIALLALCAGVKNVAVATDMNHHNHPASAAFDCFSGKCKIPGVNILCTNHVSRTPIDEATGEAVDGNFLESADGKAKYPYPEGKSWGDRKGLVFGGKNWKRVLEELLGQTESQ